MFQLFDEWRGRAHRHPEEAPFRSVHDLDEGPPARPSGSGPSIEPFGECGVCAGPRYLRTEHVGGETSRLALVCDTCGTRTEI